MGFCKVAAIGERRPKIKVRRKTAPDRGRQPKPFAKRHCTCAGRLATVKVWVNLESKIYHYQGDRFYGKTKNGKYMNEQDAIRAGYRASKTGVKQEK